MRGIGWRAWGVLLGAIGCGEPGGGADAAEPSRETHDASTGPTSRGSAPETSPDATGPSTASPGERGAREARRQ